MDIAALATETQNTGFGAGELGDWAGGSEGAARNLVGRRLGVGSWDRRGGFGLGF